MESMKLIPQSQILSRVKAFIRDHHSDNIFCYPAALEPEPPITVEAISVELLTSARPKDPAGSAPADTGFNSQEQLVGGHWFSAVSLKDELAVCTHIAGTHLSPTFIYLFTLRVLSLSLTSPLWLST